MTKKRTGMTNPKKSIVNNVPAENASYVQNLVMNNLKDLKHYAGRKRVRIDDTDEIIYRTEDYLDRAIKTSRYPTVSGLSVALGFDRRTFYDWLNNKPDHPTSKYLKEVQSMMAENLEQAALSNKVNPVTSIFLLKSTHGYKEANETTIIHKNELGNNKTEEEINKEIEADVIDVEFDENSN